MIPIVPVIDVWTFLTLSGSFVSSKRDVSGGALELDELDAAESADAFRSKRKDSHDSRLFGLDAAYPTNSTDTNSTDTIHSLGSSFSNITDASNSTLSHLSTTSVTDTKLKLWGGGWRGEVVLLDSCHIYLPVGKPGPDPNCESLIHKWPAFSYSHNAWMKYDINVKYGGSAYTLTIDCQSPRKGFINDRPCQGFENNKINEQEKIWNGLTTISTNPGYTDEKGVQYEYDRNELEFNRLEETISARMLLRELKAKKATPTPTPAPTPTPTPTPTPGATAISDEDDNMMNTIESEDAQTKKDAENLMDQIEAETADSS